MKKVTLGMLAMAACTFAAIAFAGDTLPVPDDTVDLPEPGTLGLLVAGIAAIAYARLRGRK